MKFVLIHKWGRSLGQSFIKKEPNKFGDEISELTLCRHERVAKYENF